MRGGISASGAHPFVVLVTHQHEPGFPVFREDNGFTAGNVGDVANLLVEIACRELSHGWTPISILSRFSAFAGKRARAPPSMKRQTGMPRRRALSVRFSVMPEPGNMIIP
ncbi:hypothetical protein MesoLjLb_29960 [Mesorhizobium sp. L-8-3]|nr:hypothetical protein MesoLjLb_29960 [Mesorhizobium sp. L-8-3]